MLTLMRMIHPTPCVCHMCCGSQNEDKLQGFGPMMIRIPDSPIQSAKACHRQREMLPKRNVAYCSPFILSKIGFFILIVFRCHVRILRAQRANISGNLTLPTLNQRILTAPRCERDSPKQEALRNSLEKTASQAERGTPLPLRINKLHLAGLNSQT